MAPKIPGEPPPTSSEKLAQTFRLPVDLVHFLKHEARARGTDLNATVFRYLDGVHRWSEPLASCSPGDDVPATWPAVAQGCA